MTNQSRPLFSVGEEVILQSKSSPEFNGIYVIHKILRDRQYMIDRHTGRNIQCEFNHGYFGYILDQPILSDIGNDIIWAEAALRKRYPPSSQSFSELMNTLKTPAKIS